MESNENKLDTDSMTLSLSEFLSCHLLARKLLQLSDDGEIYLGSDRKVLIQFIGKHKYLTIGQKKLLDTVIQRVSQRQINLFKLIDEGFDPEYRSKWKAQKKRTHRITVLEEIYTN